MGNKIRMKDMTWFEYAERTNDWFILPVGAVEQHGPHLPLYVAINFGGRVCRKNCRNNTWCSGSIAQLWI